MDGFLSDVGGAEEEKVENGYITWIESALVEIREGRSVEVGSVALSILVRKISDEGYAVVVSKLGIDPNPYIVRLEKAPVSTMRMIAAESPDKDVIFRNVEKLHISLLSNMIEVDYSQDMYGDPIHEEVDTDNLVFLDITIE